MNLKVILRTLGFVLVFEAICFLLPLTCSFIYSEETYYIYLLCIAINLILGGMLVLINPKNKAMYAKEGYAIVALSWIVISAFGALPFVFSGYIPNFIDAMFETASGFTTTGASVLSDVEVLPHSLLFWRSFTHWVGGMGVIVFLVAILPLSGGNNLHLIKAESPGPSVGKLVPKVKATARLLYGMYISFTVVEIVLLLAGGLSVFEALTLTFGTAGTGGFAVKNSSIAEYSPYAQNVITTFMIIFGVDFSFYYLILHRKFKTAIHSEEVRAYLGIIILASVTIAFNCLPLFKNIFEAFHHSIFQVASIMTTTGFSTFDFDKWPELSKAILVGLMFIGACAGSTGGGIKVSRILILLKSIIKEIKISVHSRMTYKIALNNRFVEHETIRAVNVFFAAYTAIFVLSMLLISMDNFDFTTNFTAVAATLNNIGPGLAGVGPVRNFAGYSDFSTVVLTLDMLLGRLEIFPILILFSASTWRK